jgi:hypothetical protein
MHTSLAAKAIGVSKSTILRAMLLPLILADPFRTILRVLIILLVAIVALYSIVVLYVIVVLLGFVGICCATIWMRMATLKAWFPPGPQR